METPDRGVDVVSSVGRLGGLLSGSSHVETDISPPDTVSEGMENVGVLGARSRVLPLR